MAEMRWHAELADAKGRKALLRTHPSTTEASDEQSTTHLPLTYLIEGNSPLGAWGSFLRQTLSAPGRISHASAGAPPRSKATSSKLQWKDIPAQSPTDGDASVPRQIPSILTMGIELILFVILLVAGISIAVGVIKSRRGKSGTRKPKKDL